MRLARIAAIAGLLTLLLATPATAGIITDVAVTKVDAPDPVAPGGNITYGITVENLGPVDAETVQMVDQTPVGTTFVSFTAPAGWTASTPAVGGTGNITASMATMPEGSAAFTLVVKLDASVLSGASITNTAAVSALFDNDQGNNSSTATTTVVAAAASVPDAAMSVSRPGSPLTVLGFAALLMGLLGTTAVMAVRRPRT